MSSAIDSIPTGQQVEKGLVFSEYDSDGYPHKADLVGFTVIPNNYLRSQLGKGSNYEPFTKYIQHIVIPDSVIKISIGSFQASALTTITMPNNDLTIEGYGFYNTSISDFVFKKDVIFPNGSVNQFYAPSQLKTVVFGGNVNLIPQGCFEFRSPLKLELLDFSNCSAIPPLYNVSALSAHKANCVIRIPLALSDQILGVGNGWESATNWSALTDIVWEAV